MAKNKVKGKKRGRIFAIFLAVDFIVLFFTLYYFSNKMLVEIGKTTYSCMLSSAAYYAISDSVTKEYNYEDIIKIHKNDSGEITMVTSNSLMVNGLASSLASNALNYLEVETKKGVPVPIGVFTGIKILSGYGTKVNMPLITVSSVKCDITSKFEEAGINQTRHAVYVEIIPEVNVVTKTQTIRVVDSITILLFDNFIVGKVPEFFIEGSLVSSESFSKN